mgnify:CR=1 FL=1
MELHNTPEQYRKPPKRVDHETAWEALNVLPPQAWRRNGYTESFRMSERWSGTMTSIYCRIGAQWFKLLDDCRESVLSHDQIVAMCAATDNT